MIATEIAAAPTVTAARAGAAFGPAMRFVLALVRLRTTSPHVARLWELAERYHPEQTWLAESWRRGDRTLDEIARTAPREPLAAALAVYVAGARQVS